jgi:dolichol-phosphate mannosyltransferase
MREFDLQVLLPVHNEAASIEATVRELYAELSRHAQVQFIFCEDGSSDNTQEVLTRLAEEIPAKLLMSTQRKGYSRAVRDGMLAMDAPYLLCLDSDGQCDPQNFLTFWQNRAAADVLIGWRVNRSDNWMRKGMSRTFFGFWKALYGCPIHDPSCPYVLAGAKTIQALAPRMGAMQEGFWWEFMARVHRLHYSIREFPVNHRERAAGVTQVYRLGKLPGIGYRHGLALFQILRETRTAKTVTLTAPPGGVATRQTR